MTSRKPQSSSPVAAASSNEKQSSAAAAAPSQRHTEPGWLSRNLYSWVTPIIAKGRKHGVHMEDTFLPRRLDTSRAYEKLQQAWDKERQRKDPSLLDAIRESSGDGFRNAALFKLMWSGCLLLAAFYFVRELINVADNTKQSNEGRGEILAVFFFVTCMVLSYAQQKFQEATSTQGIGLRGALMTAVYRKALKIDTPEPSEVLNLVSNDCMRLLEACYAIHILWSAPAEALAIVILLAVLIGEIGLIALGMITLILLSQILIGRRVAKLRTKNIIATDLRVQVMQEILSSIKLVKFYAWEDCFMQQVKKLRDKELRLLDKGAFLKTVNLMIVFVIPPIIALVLFSAYVAVEGKLDSTVAFTTLSLFNTLRFPLVVLPRAIKTYAEAKASIDRLETFLLREEISSQLTGASVRPMLEITIGNGSDYNNNNNNMISDHANSDDLGTISIDNMSVGFHKRAEKHIQAHTIEVLSSVTLTVNNGEHCAIVGPVASGKSSLLLGMLGEARIIHGDMSLTGRPAYVPQSPWIQAGTVRSNILFGLPFDQERYNHVVFACALSRDMEILPQGDMTAVAPRGINLSGGQRQRISLARAAYSRASLYLLDNPLSAVDWFTSNHIMTHCVKGIMKDATVVMVTHQLDLLPMFQKICVIRDRMSVYSGPYSPSILKEFFPNISDEDISSHDDAAGAGASAALPPPSSSSSENPSAKQAAAAPADTKKQPMPAILDHTAISDVKHVTSGPFKAWFTAGGVTLGVFSGFVYVITQVARIISDWFISVWSSGRFNLDNDRYNMIYGLLVTAFLILLFVRGIVFYHFALKAATRIHNMSFERILRAPMAIFTLTPLGNVLTLFSKDQDTVDEAIPDTIYLTFIYGLILLTTLILVCVLLPLYAIVAGLLFLATIALSWFYIRAASSLKELVLSTSAPLFSFVAESMDGIAVIRAFRADPRMCDEFLRLVNDHHAAMYCLDALQLWLGLRLGAMGSILVFATALFCVLDRDAIEPAAVGLAISNSLQKLIFYTWFVRGAADVVAHFGAVERIQYFTETMPSERTAIAPYHPPPPKWPERGCLTFEHAVMRYLPWTEPALRGVSFHINHGEKIGVVGRTGSGKSSMLMALFRMNELEGGRILVDGRNISELSLHDLRSRLSIIPQEPVMFKGTIRTNLDPFHEADDQAVWEALEICQMKQFVLNLPHQLESQVTLCGENFSLGQRQLICLGRAYLKKSSILCLDEATAAMDMETDALIQRTLQVAFAERTVITIAHRLDTVIESDRILVLDNGYVVEFDTPTSLLRNRTSSFSKLVDQVGSHRAVLEERAVAHEQIRSQELAIMAHREHQMASLKRSAKQNPAQAAAALAAIAAHPTISNSAPAVEEGVYRHPSYSRPKRHVVAKPAPEVVVVVDPPTAATQPQPTQNQTQSADTSRVQISDV